MEPAIPGGGVNNLWYSDEQSDSVIIFVHGVLSDSRSCWLNTDRPDQLVYWPHLVKNDPRFKGTSIYLGGYYTAIDSGPYEIQDCAVELFNGLRRQDVIGHRPVLSHRRMVFVCHSTGGIVVRYLLDRYRDSFVGKQIGLVLIASPSFGSSVANRLDWLANFYKHRLGLQLQWGSWSLKDLDARFKDLVNARQLHGLIGVEAYENHFILHRKLLPDKTFVVSGESAGRYFGAPVLLRKTDHFSSVKPDSLTHPAHELLVDFFTRDFNTPSGEPASVSRALPSIQRIEKKTEILLQGKNDVSNVPEGYELIDDIHRGHYSKVLRCRIRATGEACILKRTPASLVSVRSLQTLQRLQCPNVITPRRVLATGDYVWEELPLVQGTPLSQAIADKVGGLTGSLLASCHRQLMSTLQRLHALDLIFRNVHPDNVMLCVSNTEPADTAHPEDSTRLLDMFGCPPGFPYPATEPPFFVTWLLTDSTLVVLSEEADRVPPALHGSATPEEQAAGRPILASDMYALGATLYFGITGQEVPSPARRQSSAELLTYPNGSHDSVDFGDHLASLLALDASRRPPADAVLNPNTTFSGYTGTVRLGSGSFILADRWSVLTRLVSAAAALQFHLNRKVPKDGEPTDRDYWIANLTKMVPSDR